MNKFQDITEQIQEKVEKAEEQDRPVIIHELKSEINQHPGQDYVMQHGTTGATVSRDKVWIRAESDGTLQLQDVKDVECCPGTGPRTEVRESEDITVEDAVSRIVHDLEQRTPKQVQEDMYNSRRLEYGRGGGE